MFDPGSARFSVQGLWQRIERLNAIGVALSASTSTEVLLETILLGAKDLTAADAGTLYAVKDGQAVFRILRNDRQGIALGGTAGKAPDLPAIPLRLADGSENQASVVAHAVLTGTTVNISDAYDAPGFDFAGTRAFDARTGYRSTSFLTVPMRNHEGRITGVLQLINAKDAQGDITRFSSSDQRLVESLASQAAAALTKQELVDGMGTLFEAFIELIAAAIDEKSPYTGGHCRRVPELTMLLAEACAAESAGPLASFSMSESDRYELRIAAWLHDCGKITTPEWVMDKATKLSGLHDRLAVVEARFATARAQAETACWRSIAEGGDAGAARAALAETIARLQEDLGFLRHVNLGGESMRIEDQQRVGAIANQLVPGADGALVPLLSPDEVRNLCIPRGTLLPEERQIINQHMTATIRMLEALPYPSHLRRVPEFAGGHHERMDGKGYPKGLTREQMSVQARIMGIADVFEALTAGDRPYKKAMPLSQALAILQHMSESGHIDPDIYAVFLRRGVWRRYAERFLPPAQVDC